MSFATTILLIWLVFVTASWSSEITLVRAEEVSPQQLELFERQIRPLLIEHCLKCHGPEKQEGGLNLATREALMKGGDSGAAVISGKPTESLLIQAVEYLGEPKMPPSGKLPSEKIELLRRWVASGSAWPKDSPLSDGATVTRGFQINEKQKLKAQEKAKEKENELS